jgi:light-regulated signal transduction histidine kinase (bacteriophytochrome)
MSVMEWDWDRASGPMDNVQELQAELSAEPRPDEGVRIQSAGYLLELSLDWIVLRASENVHHLLGESHVTLIDEPLGRFVHSQALHDLRNLFSRLSGTTGIGRAYGVRLTDEPDLVDVAFQLSHGRVVFEAVPSSGSYGEAFGTVGGLIAGLSNTGGQGLLEGGARRMRALTGYDRVTLICGDSQAESSRGAFSAPADLSAARPAIIADTQAEPVAVFPRSSDEPSAADALLHSPDAQTREALSAAGVRSSMRVPFSVDGLDGEFRCDSRAPRAPSFELHAAAELFAQLFAMRLEIDQLKSG